MPGKTKPLLLEWGDDPASADTGGAFEARLRHCTREDRMPVIVVADTAWLAIGWLQDRKIPFTAADVLKMTEMILAERKYRERPLGSQFRDAPLDGPGES